MIDFDWIKQCFDFTEKEEEAIKNGATLEITFNDDGNILMYYING